MTTLTEPHPPGHRTWGPPEPEAFCPGGIAWLYHPEPGDFADGLTWRHRTVGTIRAVNGTWVYLTVGHELVKRHRDALRHPSLPELNAPVGAR